MSPWLRLGAAVFEFRRTHEKVTPRQACAAIANRGAQRADAAVTTAMTEKRANGDGIAASGALELQLGEPGVETTRGHKRFVPAFLDDAAGINHQDAIARQHGGQPVRDD